MANGVHSHDWDRDHLLVGQLLEILDVNQVKFDWGIYCRNAWRARGETVCNGALITLTLESQALDLYDWGVEHPNPSQFYRELEQLARDHRAFWERGFLWSIHLYPI